MHRLVLAVLFVATALPSRGGLRANEFSDPQAWPADDLVRALYGPDRLAPESHGEFESFECGEDIAAQIRERWDEISPEAKEWLPRVDSDRGAVVRGFELDEWFDTPHFRLYYTQVGEDAIDLGRRDRLASLLEQAREFFVSDPGFRMRAPVGDGPVGSAGVPLIQVYVFFLDDYYGFASSWTSPDSECSNGGGAHIGFHSGVPESLEPFITAHELFHVCETANSTGFGKFFREATADWSTTHAWGENAYPLGRTHHFLRSPYLALAYPYGHQLRVYGGSVFWRFLDQRYTTPTDARWPATQTWWRVCDEEDWFEVLLDQFAERGVSALELLHEFSVWNQHAGPFDDGRHYDQGDRIANVNVQSWIREYPIVNRSIPNEQLATWTGSNHLRFEGKASRRSLRFRLEGDPRMADHRRVTLIGTTLPANHVQFETKSPDASGVVEYLVDDWHLFDVIHVVLTNGPNTESLPEEALDYVFHAEEVGEAVVDVAWSTEATGIQNAPDPFTTGTFIRFEVQDAERPTRLRLVDVGGRRVATLVNERLSVGLHNRAWGGTDEAGRSVGAGVYFLVLETGERRSFERVVKVR
jgi:hypothetical protein